MDIELADEFPFLLNITDPDEKQTAEQMFGVIEQEFFQMLPGKPTQNQINVAMFSVTTVNGALGVDAGAGMILSGGALAVVGAAFWS